MVVCRSAGVGSHGGALPRVQASRLTQTLLSDSAMELLLQASQGLPRQAGRLLHTAMRLAVPKGLNHLPDELIREAIEVLQ